MYIQVYINMYIYIYEACHLFFTTAVTFIIALHVTLHVPFTELHGLRYNDRSPNRVSDGMSLAQVTVSFGRILGPSYESSYRAREHILTRYKTQLQQHMYN